MDNRPEYFVKKPIRYVVIERMIFFALGIWFQTVVLLVANWMAG